MSTISTSPQYVVVTLTDSVIVLVKGTGKILTYKHDYKTSTKADEQELDCATFSPNHKYFGALFSDKSLTVWLVDDAGKGLSQHLKVAVSRRATSLVFDCDETKVFVADKAGDLYMYDLTGKAQTDQVEPLLGHVSMLLDVAVTDNFIITADRDEKLRISDKKIPYVIQSYCLGHREFVCKVVCVNENLILSLSGDGTARLWDFVNGKQIQAVKVIPDAEQKAENDESADNNVIKHVPSLAAYNATSKLFVIGSIKDEKLGVYHFSDKSLTYLYNIEISNVASIDFDSSSSLLYILHETTAKLCVTICKLSADSYSTQDGRELVLLNEHLANEKKFKVKSYADLFKPPMKGTKKYVDFFKKKNEGKLFCKPDPKKAKLADT